MLSRVAESFYWMQRYRERAENVARLLEVNLHLSTDAPSSIGNQWEPMILTTGGHKLFTEKYKTANEKNVIHFLTLDAENPNSILSCLRLARENARSIRETIASEIWDEINTAYLFAQKAALSKSFPGTPYHFFNRIKRQCQLITGIADTCMSHGEAWYFGRMGNLLERSDMTTRMLDTKYFMLLRSVEDIGTPFDNIQWMALLKSASALDTYRKAWQLVSPPHVVDFLFLDAFFPRSVLYCLKGIEQSLSVISDYEAEKQPQHPYRVTEELVTELERMNGRGILAQGLHEFIDDLQLKIMKVDQSIYDRYFALQY